MSSLQQRSTEEAVLDSVKSQDESKMKGLFLEESIARNLKTAEQLYEMIVTAINVTIAGVISLRRK